MSLVRPGKYKAKIVDYGIELTNAGKPQIVISFSFDCDENSHELKWYGSLNEGKARMITFETLLLCEFIGDDLAALADGVDDSSSALLNLEKFYEVTIIKEEDGRIRIRWVNECRPLRRISRQEAEDKISELPGINSDFEEQLLRH